MKRTRISDIAAWGWMLGLALGVAPAASAAGPDWWIARGVVNTNAATTNDFAPVNQGTVKWFATNAFDELEAYLPGGAGTGVAALVAGFSPSNNYRMVNQGQMKNLAKPFYDRLIAVGYTNDYPWTAATNDDASYQVANIGQVKNLFRFQFNWASIAGTIGYTGAQAGTLFVVAVTQETSWATAHSTTLASPGAYTITNVPRYWNYWVKAWRDSSGNGSNDYWEAWGACASNPVYLTDNRTGLNVTLSDPDSDGEGLADYYELQLGTSPTNTDTDGDLISDYEEVVNRHTDPLNSDTNVPTVVISMPAAGAWRIWIP